MILSKLAPILPRARRLPTLFGSCIGRQPVRYGSEKKVMYIFRSNTVRERFRKYVLFYTAVGLIPTLLIILYTSYIVGEAELYDYDPEQYEPEYHEFFAHPITRFLAKYCVEDPKIRYYKEIYAVEYETNTQRMWKLVKSVYDIERHLELHGWNRWEDPIRNKEMKRRMDEYVKEHDIGVDHRRAYTEPKELDPPE